jgi:trimethylamine--corrinoid protein Co-methyltransferase
MVSRTPDLIPITTDLKLETLSRSDLDSIKANTLRILDEVGVRFPSPKALEIFSLHGAKVDMDTRIVRIPPDLVKKAMSTAPRAFVLGGREERFDLLLDGTKTYLTTDGCGVHVIDLETRVQRASRKADLEMMAQVADALPMVGFFWPLVSAQDRGRTAQLHEAHAGLTNTLKHVRGGTTMFPQLAPYLVEMATVVAGSEEVRRKRSPVCGNICTVAPLAQDRDGIETALVFAEAGIPTSFMAMPTIGSTAPASLIGAVSVGDAEVVSAMVLMQLAYPGAPVFHSNLISLMDPHTGGYIGEVPFPLPIMMVQLAHAWGVPSLGGGSVSSDAEVIGWQSGQEAGMGATLIPLAGGEVCGYLGMIASSMILYPEQIILDYELCQNVVETFKTYPVDPDDFPFEVIKEVGPGGHYLRQKHTAAHLRDFRYSTLLRKKDADGNPRDPQEVALEEFKHILETHHPEPLPDDVLKELDLILESAEREAEKLVDERD